MTEFFTVSVPATLLITVEAESVDDIDEGLVRATLLNDHGKYPQLTLDHFATDDFEVLS